MIYEYSKSYLRKEYNGNKAAMRKAGDCTIWTPERIKETFARGQGTEKDLRRYMNSNKQFCFFEER